MFRVNVNLEVGQIRLIRWKGTLSGFLTCNNGKNNFFFLLDLFQVIVSVLVCHVRWTDMQFEVWAKVLKVVIIREFCKNKNQVQKKTWYRQLILMHTTDTEKETKSIVSVIVAVKIGQVQK